MKDLSRFFFLRTSVLPVLFRERRTTRLLVASGIASFFVFLALAGCKKQQPAPLKTKALSASQSAPVTAPPQPDYREKYTGIYTVHCVTYFYGYGQYNDSSSTYQLTVEKAKSDDVPMCHSYGIITGDSSVAINPVKQIWRDNWMVEGREVWWMKESGRSKDSIYCRLNFRNDSIFYDREYNVGRGTCYIRLTGRKN
jgi:hypothetical protein